MKKGRLLVLCLAMSLGAAGPAGGAEGSKDPKEATASAAPGASSRFGSMSFVRPKFGSASEDAGTSFYKPGFGSHAATSSASPAEGEGQDPGEGGNRSKYGSFGNYSGSDFKMGSTSSK